MRPQKDPLNRSFHPGYLKTHWLYAHLLARNDKRFSIFIPARKIQVANQQQREDCEKFRYLDNGVEYGFKFFNPSFCSRLPDSPQSLSDFNRHQFFHLLYVPLGKGTHRSREYPIPCPKWIARIKPDKNKDVDFTGRVEEKIVDSVRTTTRYGSMILVKWGSGFSYSPDSEGCPECCRHVFDLRVEKMTLVQTYWKLPNKKASP